MPQQSSEHRQPKGKDSGDGLVKQIAHAYNIPNLHVFNQIQLNPAPSATALRTTGGGKYFGTFNHKELVGKVKNVNVRYDVTENNTADLEITAAPYFAAKTEWKLENGTVWKTDYGDTQFVENCAFVPEYIQDRDNLNVSDAYAHGRVHKQNTTKSYRVRLVSHPWANNEMRIKKFPGKEIRVEINFASSIVTTGSGVPNLTNVYLEFEHELLTDKDEAEHQKSDPARGYNYVDVIHIQETSKTLTASTQAKIDLDTLAGKKVPFLMFAVRADSYSSTNDGYIKTLDLGEDATIDILDSKGTSILGQGTPIKASWLAREVVSGHLECPKFNYYRNWYIVPFCHNLRRAMAGHMDGYMQFGSNMKLAITPDAAGTSEVLTITCTNVANDGGYYKLGWQGDLTDDLKFDTSAANIKAALEALPSFQDHPDGPLTVTASGALTTTATLTFASNVEPPCERYGDIQVIPHTLNDGTIAEVTSTAISTTGRKGWTTGSSYTVDVYAYYFRKLVLGHDAAGREGMRAVDM